MRRLPVFAGVLTLSCLTLAAQWTLAAEKKAVKENAKEPTLETMRAHRIKLREDLMVPSLKGIRGLGYGTPGHCPYPGLDKTIQNSLKQLSVPMCKISELENGVTKPIDALVQIKVLAAGTKFSMVELTVTQWCSLIRDPKLKVRTITYTDQAVTSDGMVPVTVARMVDQFVIDFMKANSASPDLGSKKAGEKKKQERKKS